MKNYKLTIEYDGSGYHGYQRQVGQITIQEVLERALGKLFKTQIKTNGSGRTDTGVHALGQVVNFTSSTYVPLEKLKFALNNLLPDDIKVLNAQAVELDFHARYSAQSKHYKYRILNTEQHSPFVNKYMWQLSNKLDLNAMQAATELIKGEQDFSSFRSTGSIQGSAVRNIYQADWSLRPFSGALYGLENNNCRIYEFDIHGNGFLYHMVRNLVAAFVQVGIGRISVAEFEQILINRKRTSKSVIAPAQGLYLYKVEY